jgi:hypothetical protein
MTNIVNFFFDRLILSNLKIRRLILQNIKNRNIKTAIKQIKSYFVIHFGYRSFLSTMCLQNIANLNLKKIDKIPLLSLFSIFFFFSFLYHWTYKPWSLLFSFPKLLNDLNYGLYIKLNSTHSIFEDHLKFPKNMHRSYGCLWRVCRMEAKENFCTEPITIIRPPTHRELQVEYVVWYPFYHVIVILIFINICINSSDFESQKHSC